jgi:hypothetical protein
MRRLVLIAVLALVSASAQAGGTRSLSRDAMPNDAPVVTKGPSKSSVLAGDSRSLSNGATASDSTATTNTPPKSGAVSAQTGGPVTTTPTATPPAVETPRYAPPPGYVPPPAPPAIEAPKAVDTTRNTETPAQTQVQPPVQNSGETPTQTQTPRYTARPAAVDSTPVDATPPSTRQHIPSREAREWHGRARHSDHYGSGWSDYGWDYRRPRFRSPHWSTRRILAALHRYGFFW